MVLLSSMTRTLSPELAALVLVILTWRCSTLAAAQVPFLALVAAFQLNMFTQ
jgi:hypothetical protein